MNNFRRYNFAWSHNELERLNREYENQKLTVQEISVLHERSVRSIIFKLESEGLINKWEEARGWYTYAKKMDYPEYSNAEEEDKENEKEEEEEEEEEEKEKANEYDRYNIKQETGYVQTQINNIKKIVSDIFYTLPKNNNSKEQPFFSSYN